jgi:soluble lytic murein transglycosylase
VPAASDDLVRPPELARAAHAYASGHLAEAETLAAALATARPAETLAGAAARLLLFTAARERDTDASGYASRAAELAAAPAPLRDLLDDFLLDAVASHHAVACGGLDAVVPWRRLITAHPASPLVDRALWGLARCDAASGRAKEAADHLRLLLATPPRWLDAADARLRLADALAADKKDAAARDVLIEIAVKFPLSKAAGEATRRLDAAAPGTLAKLMTLERKLDRLDAMLEARAPETACPEAAALWAAAPKAPLDLRAGALQARCLLQAKDFGGAGKLFEDLSARALKRGDAARAAALLFDAAKAHGGRHKGEESPERAAELYDRFAHDYPADKRAPEARFMAAYTLFTLDEFAEAAARFDDFATAYPADERAGAAVWYGGWVRWMSGDAPGALARFEALEKRGGADAAKGSYWRARALAARPDKSGASAATARKLWQALAARDPFGWYGLLARARLAEAGAPSGPFGVGVAPPGPPATADPAADPVGGAAWRFVLAGDAAAAAALPPGATAPAARRALALLAVGLRPEAAAALRDARTAVEKAGGKDGRRGYLTLLAAAEDHAATRRLAAAAAGLAAPPAGEAARDWGWAFPRAFEAEVAAAAAAHGVPPALLYAVMHKESGFDPRAVSYADAVGLMQLLPKTARKIAARRGAAYSEGALFDPAANVDTAAWYLGALLAKFHGQLPLAVGAYNGGPVPMARWLDTFGARPFDELVESVTYAQSREYIKKVCALYARYAYLYEGKSWLPPAAVDRTYGADIDF